MIQLLIELNINKKKCRHTHTSTYPNVSFFLIDFQLHHNEEEGITLTGKILQFGVPK